MEYKILQLILLPSNRYRKAKQGRKYFTHGCAMVKFSWAFLYGIKLKYYCFVLTRKLIPPITFFTIIDRILITLVYTTYWHY